MRIRFQADADLKHAIVAGTLRRTPSLDFRRAEAVPLEGFGDPIMLAFVNLISRTTTAKGLQVTCRLDRRKYPTGRKVTDEEIGRVNLQQNKFHGEWNYTIHPSTYQPS